MSENKLDLGIVEETEITDEMLMGRTYSIEQVASILEEAMPKVDIEVEHLHGCPINKDLFQKGIDMISIECGMISALNGIGVPLDIAVEFVLAKYGKGFLKSKDIV